MRVLVAEDDTTSRRMLQIMLAKWGYEVAAVCDGNEAWRELEAEDPPQLAVLDWMMPGIDGVEICRRVRECNRPGGLYILLLTAKGHTEDIVSGLEAGANDYITKPFNSQELRARVQVGERVVELQTSLARRVRELEHSLEHVKLLQGLLPICARCHKIRDDQSAWHRLEEYIETHSDAQFSHGLCPDCLVELYPEMDDLARAKQKNTT